MANLFEIAVARKLSGGGGGDSDFSTATVTFINSDNTTDYSAWVYSIDGDKLERREYHVSESQDVVVPLYKGETFLSFSDLEGVTQFVGASGDITVGAMGATVKGNCTITAKGTPIS